MENDLKVQRGWIATPHFLIFLHKCLKLQIRSMQQREYGSI
jgi:hypothetical protein